MAGIRLNVILVKIPPLRERPDDIPALISYFVARYCKENQLPVPRFDKTLIAFLSRLQWIGNVRQLENTLIRMLVLNKRTFSVKDIPEDIQEQENLFLQNAMAS